MISALFKESEHLRIAEAEDDVGDLVLLLCLLTTVLSFELCLNQINQVFFKALDRHWLTFAVSLFDDLVIEVFAESALYRVVVNRDERVVHKLVFNLQIILDLSHRQPVDDAD